MPVEVVNPKIVSQVIRFITSDVALVDGASIYDSDTGSESTPLLFVMKKEGERWMITACREVVQR
jgi:hypothetical protein